MGDRLHSTGWQITPGSKAPSTPLPLSRHASGFPLWLAKERPPLTLAAAALTGCGATWLWKPMLNVRHASVVDGADTDDG